MGRESPEDIERSSDDILDILEQDITIPFDCPTALLNDPVSPNGSTYAAPIGPRSRGLIASAEPEPKLPTPRRGTSNKIAPTVSITSREHREDRWEENAAEQSGSGEANRKLARGQNIISETAIGVEELELEDGRTVDLQGSEEEGRQFLPIPVARAKRGRSFRTTASALPRRTRTVASAGRAKPIETVSDNEEETLNSVERQAKAPIARRTSTSKSKARPRKVKEELEIPVAAKNSKTTRSATVAGDKRKSFAAAKAPATRTSSRRAPVTASSGAPADERENRDKKNPSRSEAVPHEGASTKIIRNRKPIAEVPTTSKTAATTRIKDEDEDEAPRRSTRARARTKT
jgi:hypothetical protein